MNNYRDMLKALLDGEYLLGSLENKVIYIDDFVDGVCAVLQRQTKAFDVINLGSGVQTSNARLVETVEAVLGHKFAIEATLPRKSNDACVWMTDPTHAHQKYGFRATTTLEQGVHYMANVLGHLT